jgi:hypothetical protein
MMSEKPSIGLTEAMGADSTTTMHVRARSPDPPHQLAKLRPLGGRAGPVLEVSSLLPKRIWGT